MNVTMVELTELEKELLLKLVNNEQPLGVLAMERALLDNPLLMLNMLKKVALQVRE